MSMPAPNIREYNVEVVTEHYLYSARFSPVGAMLAYLSNKDRKNLQLKNVTATALNPNSLLATFTAEELWTNREEVIAMRFAAQLSSNTVPLMPNKEKLRIFLPYFVVQGLVAHGMDTPLGEIFDSTKGEWIPVSEAQIFPIIQTKARIAREPAMIFIGKKYIQSYQAVP